MNKYYKPVKEEFVADLECELYDEEFNSWTPVVLDKNSSSAFLPLLEQGDIRVKYLHSTDFNKLGYTLKLNKIGKETLIVDILPNGKEITEERDVFDKENLTILHKGLKVGYFYPYKPEKNVELAEKTHTVRNISELRKILK